MLKKLPYRCMLKYQDKRGMLPLQRVNNRESKKPLRFSLPAAAFRKHSGFIVYLISGEVDI